MARAVDFWTSILAELEATLPAGEKSVPTYYSDGEAGEGEFGNIIQVMFERTEPGSTSRTRIVNMLDQAGFWLTSDKLDFWVNADVATLGADLDNLKAAAEQRLPSLTGDVDVVAGQTAGQGDKSGFKAPVGLRPGGSLVRIDGDGVQQWGIMYVVGGIEHIYTFDSEEAMKAALGQNAAAEMGMTILPASTVNDGNTWILGAAAGHVGQTQNYQAYWADVLKEAGLEAGIRNPGMLGRYMADPAIQRIIAEAAAGNWSDEREMAEIRRTDFYLNTLYPGIESILESGLPNPEAQYNQYMTTVDGSLESLGYERDADGTYRSQVGNMLGAGIKADKFVGFAPTFIKAQTNAEFGNVLSAWTQKDLGVSLNFSNWFDVLEGNTSPEIDEVVQKANIAYRAQQGELGLADDVVSRIAAATDLNVVQINAAFTSSEQALFALGDRGLAITGLSIEDLISAPLDIAGSSGLSPQEVRSMARKVSTELGVRDDPKATLFQSFSKRGVPITPGQTVLRPEAG